MRVLAGVLAALLLLSVAFPRQKEQPEDPRIALWQAKYAEASSRVVVRVDTVRQLVPRYIERRDTLLLNLTDTVEVLKFIAVADSTIRACAALANDCEAQKRASDFYVAGLQGELATARRKAERQRLLSRFGLSVGYGVMKVGEDVKAGPIVGVTVRVFP